MACYYANPQVQRDLTKATIKRNREHAWSWLLAHPCVDCGEGDPVVLDFDHVRGEKDRAVSLMVRNGVSIEKLQAEIDKCDVRCANCHRRVTHRRRLLSRCRLSSAGRAAVL